MGGSWARPRDAAARAHPSGGGGGLVCHAGMPPTVEVKDVVGGREIQPDSAGLGREDEDRHRAVGLLAAIDHLLAPRLRRAAMHERRLDIEVLANHRGQQVAHPAILRKDQRAVAGGEEFFQHLHEPGALAGA